MKKKQNHNPTILGFYIFLFFFHKLCNVHIYIYIHLFIYNYLLTHVYKGMSLYFL